jgi:coenzyme Q-binding protein COQ10
MPSCHQIRILPYHAQELFELVLDVDSYHDFVPWCKGSKIISKNDEEIIAELVIQAKGFVDKYQSKITPKIINEHTYYLEAEAISGPFKYLKNTWKFVQEGKFTTIEFSIDFQMKFAILDKVMGIFFIDATKKMIEAFEKRAILKFTEIK